VNERKEMEKEQYPLFKPKAGETYECTKRGCLRYVRGDRIVIAKVTDVAMIPEGKPHIRLMPTVVFWKKIS